jgi:glycosyltransferase involved in cell wall biosynthesis
VAELDYDVVIPTRGSRPALIDAALGSVYGQTISPARVIVVVDGAAGAAAGIAARWPQAEVVALPRHGGSAVARQRGIAAATAEWVCFLDDDDLWATEKMEVTALYLSEHADCEAVRSVYYVFAAPGDPVDGYMGQRIDLRGADLAQLERDAAGRRPVNDFTYLRIEGDSLGLLLERNRGVIGSTCVRRSVLDRLPAVPEGTRPGEDHVLFCLVAAHTEWHLIDEPLLFYRVHGGQDSRLSDPGAGRGIIRSIQTCWELCGRAAPRPLASYGSIYRREFRPFLWRLARRGHLVESGRTYLAAIRLLPRLRDRLLLLVPEPVAWRWHHRWRRPAGIGSRAAPDPMGSPLRGGTSARPELSVCIVTYERPVFLQRCVAALDGAVDDDVEIVVVDASARSSADLVEEIRPSAVYVHAPELAGWMTRSRNASLRWARGRVIAFLDDDVVVGPGWQEALLRAFDDPTVDAVAGRTRNLQPGEESYDLPVGRLLPDGSMTEGFASVQPSPVDVDHGIGANMSFRRSVLAELGGFRDDYPGTAIREDTDIFLRIKRLGRRAVFAPEAVVDHRPAPHVHGARFDTRYKLYGRRNHMVLLARYAGIGSSLLRRWTAREFGSIGHVPGIVHKANRLAVVTVGVGWGAAAVLRDARWRPLPAARTDPLGRELRRVLSDDGTEPADGSGVAQSTS